MKIFVVAGEKSGDKQGALVIQELLRRRPDAEIVGLGGNRMHALAPGVEDWADAAAVIHLDGVHIFGRTDVAVNADLLAVLGDVLLALQGLQHLALLDLLFTLGNKVSHLTLALLDLG